MTENKILLSIIIPHFNSADLLGKLLSTIPENQQIEVIVVDDHSTEKLEQLSQCRQRYEGRNIFFYENVSQKKGAGAARNIGIRCARGTYLMFADADDWFVDGFWDAMQKSLKSGADVIYFAPTSQKADGRKSARHQHYAKLVREYARNAAHRNEVRLRCLFWSPCSKLIKRSLILKNRILFDETLYANDIVFSVKLGIAAKSIGASVDTVYCILEHEGSLSTYRDDAAMMQRWSVHCRYYFYLRSRLDRQDFRLLGYTSKFDREQIRHMASVLRYGYQCGRKWKSMWEEQRETFRMIWQSFVLSNKERKRLRNDYSV